MLDILPGATLVGRDAARQVSSITKLIEVCLDQLASPLPLAALLGKRAAMGFSLSSTSYGSAPACALARCIR